MIRALAIAAVLALTASSALADAGGPYRMSDKLHRCVDAKGGMVATSMCAAPAPTTAGAPNCKKGKPCGKSCIAMDKVCHIK